MQEILNKLQQHPWKESLRYSCRINGIKTSLATTFTPLKIIPLYHKLQKTYHTNQTKATSTWFENELKAFHWMLIVISYLQQIKICQFAANQWAILHSIFSPKQHYFLQYESIRLLANKSRTIWEVNQDRLLKQAINDLEHKNKWNEVARKLFQASQCQYYRSGKECRERWYNHLDPNKKHGGWTHQEDQTIAQFIIHYGKKWSELARKMGNVRTEHMVKNRYKSIIIHLKKNYPMLHQEEQLLQHYYTNQHNKQPINQQFQNQKENTVQQDIKDSPKIEECTVHKKQQFFKNSQQSSFNRYSPTGNALGDSQLKLISPFCVTYTPQSLTPPLYATPPPSMPFFMTNFTQRSLLWTNILQQSQKKLNDNPTDC